MKRYVKEYKDYIFIGNTPAGKDLSKFKNIKYIVGELALDIHGKPLDKNYMLPFYVAKESYDEYNRIMQAELEAIRRS